MFHASHLASGGLLAVIGIPWLVEATNHPSLCLHLRMAFSLCECLCPNFPFL